MERVESKDFGVALGCREHLEASAAENAELEPEARVA